MADDNIPAPVLYKGVMVSSTFTDLIQHRAALIRAIDGQKLKSEAMEHDSAKPDGDVIDSSLQKVRDGSAYVGVISHKYGQIPECSKRNPKRLSLTELEFIEARDLKRPVLLFIMGDDHAVKRSDVETDPEKIKKLEAFRETAKRLKPESSVHRIYKVFNNLHEFDVAATQAIADLRRHLDERDKPAASQPKEQEAAPDTTTDKPAPIPTPPAFYAELAYIGSHDFVGRRAELEKLSDWAAAADPYPVLLFEAIGGAGKSMLTWEWTNRHATAIRSDWAGIFWYSFYERGALMADFCRRALAYITGRPLKDFRKKKTLELGEQLVRHLQDKPWLLILDGLERVLVAYHRFDAAQLLDEDAGTTDEIANRDPCAAIRPEDDDLLRTLTTAAPSKLLLTSRLTPRVLLNQSSQPIPGVLRERLPGLRPADAEALLRACGVTGTSRDMQSYLMTHCDCHPLVTGALAGLINDYLPDRGNFDAWAADPDHGGRLNLADLDLVQKRNHILRAALAALPGKSRQLLSTLAMLSEAVDYATLSAFNPHLPEDQSDIADPRKLDEEFRNTVLDLEMRGLLPYDGHAKRFDLHPVVRGIAAGGLRQEEKELYGQRVVDHFSLKFHNPYEEAETLEDVSDGLHIVRTLLQMGRHQQAFEAYCGDLSRALYYNLEANAEVLSLLRPFFHQDWATLPNALDKRSALYVTTDAANALSSIGETEVALTAYGATLTIHLAQVNWIAVHLDLTGISGTLFGQNRLARADRFNVLCFDLAALLGSNRILFRTRLDRFRMLTGLGRWADAEAIWQLLDPMGRDWSRHTYLPGGAEFEYAAFRFCKGDVADEHLAKAEQLAKAGRNRVCVRNLHDLRGTWQLKQGRWALAADSLHEAVRMAREVGQTDAKAEARLALAKFHLGQLPNPQQEAERLATARKPSHRAIAELWLAIGDAEQAKKHAFAAYKSAWADGEPYVFRYKLNKARDLLERLGAAIPDLPPYDPAKDEKLPWENEVAAAIEKLRAEKEAEQAK